jgi:ribosomal protein L40E
MQCLRCQQDNPIHARFCLGCGARLARVYGACGADWPPGARFCLTSKIALEGEPQEVTVRPGNPGRSTVLSKREALRLFGPFDRVRRCLATPRRFADE